MYRFCSLTQELARLQVYQGIAENVITGGCIASIFTIHISRRKHYGKVVCLYSVLRYISQRGDGDLEDDLRFIQSDL